MMKRLDRGNESVSSGRISLVVLTPREPVCEKARNKNGGTSCVEPKKVLDLSIIDHILFKVTRELSYVNGTQNLLSSGRHDV